MFTPEEAEKLAQQMIGHKLITKQTGEKGIQVNKVSGLKEFRKLSSEIHF